MKIALLHFAYPPNTGGVEILLREHALILTKLGHQVSLFVGSGEEKDTRIKLSVVPEFQSVMNFNPHLQEKILEKGVIDDEFSRTSEFIEQKLKKLLVDQEVVIIHNMLTIVRNLPFNEALRRYTQKHPEKKFIIWVHDHSYINEFKIKDLSAVVTSEKEKTLLTQPINNVVYIAISEAFKKPLVKLLNITPEKVIVIPDGITIQSFLEIDPSVHEIFEKNNLLSAFPLMLSPVNILDRKNLDYCIDIISSLKKSYPQIRYIITGNPSKHHSTLEYLNKLKNQVKQLELDENVLFLGEYFNRFLKQSEIHDFYTLSDIILYLSKSENFGLPLLESALSKTPIFVSDLEVFREIGGNQFNYIDYKNTSPEKAAGIIKDFIETNNQIKTNYHVRSNYDLMTIIKNKLIPLIS